MLQRMLTYVKYSASKRYKATAVSSLHPTGLFVEVTETYTHLMTCSVMCLLHTQVKAMAVVVVVVLLRRAVQVVSGRLHE
jgi:hypothetical protein